MTKTLEKAKQLFDKLPLNEAIEVYNELGNYLHQKIEDGRKQFREMEAKLKKDKPEN